MFIIGAAMSVVIRAELSKPGLQFVEPEFFNQMTTMHALVMIFGGVMPAFVGLANWMMPLQIGAPDMALPRMNNWSFWIMPFAFTLLLMTLFLPGGAPAGGWTLYPPLSLQGGYNVAFTDLRHPHDGHQLDHGRDQHHRHHPQHARAGHRPAEDADLLLDLADHRVPADRGDAGAGRRGDHAADRQVLRHQLLQRGRRRRPGDVPAHLLVLRASRGLHHDPAGVRDRVARSSRPSARKPLFGYQAMVYATASIAFLSFIVWAHHMFTVGMPLGGEIYFMFATMLIAIPTGVKVFNWVSTMWRGSLSFEAPMLWAIAFVILFTIGGFSGLMLAIVPADFQYHDTYFVVAHFHYVLVTGALFAIIAAVYYWWPKWTGPHVQPDSGARCTSGGRSCSSTCCSSRSTSSAWPACRAASRTTIVVFADWNLISSIGAFGMFVTPFMMLSILWHLDAQRRQGRGARLGRRARPGVDRAVAGAAPHLHHAAGDPSRRPGPRRRQPLIRSR